MGRVGFNFPIFLTLIHYAVAWILLAFFKSLSLLPMSPPSKTTPFSSLFSLGAVMAFASGLANTSLKHNRFIDQAVNWPLIALLIRLYRVIELCFIFLSQTWKLLIFLVYSVGFYQMAKIAVTPTIVLAEFVLFKKTISSTKVVAWVLWQFTRLIKKNSLITRPFCGCLLCFRVCSFTGHGIRRSVSRRGNRDRNRSRIQFVRRIGCSCMDYPKRHQQNPLV